MVVRLGSGSAKSTVKLGSGNAKAPTNVVSAKIPTKTLTFAPAPVNAPKSTGFFDASAPAPSKSTFQAKSATFPALNLIPKSDLKAVIPVNVGSQVAIKSGAIQLAPSPKVSNLKAVIPSNVGTAAAIKSGAIQLAQAPAKSNKGLTIPAPTGRTPWVQDPNLSGNEGEPWVPPLGYENPLMAHTVQDQGKVAEIHYTTPDHTANEASIALGVPIDTSSSIKVSDILTKINSKYGAAYGSILMTAGISPNGEVRIKDLTPNQLDLFNSAVYAASESVGSHSVNPTLTVDGKAWVPDTKVSPVNDAGMLTAQPGYIDTNDSVIKSILLDSIYKIGLPRGKTINLSSGGKQTLDLSAIGGKVNVNAISGTEASKAVSSLTVPVDVGAIISKVPTNSVQSYLKGKLESSGQNLEKLGVADLTLLANELGAIPKSGGVAQLSRINKILTESVPTKTVVEETRMPVEGDTLELLTTLGARLTGKSGITPTTPILDKQLTFKIPTTPSNPVLTGSPTKLSSSSGSNSSGDNGPIVVSGPGGNRITFPGTQKGVTDAVTQLSKLPAGSTMHDIRYTDANGKIVPLANKKSDGTYITPEATPYNPEKIVTAPTPKSSSSSSPESGSSSSSSSSSQSSSSSGGHSNISDQEMSDRGLGGYSW